MKRYRVMVAALFVNVGSETEARLLTQAIHEAMRMCAEAAGAGGGCRVSYAEERAEEPAPAPSSVDRSAN